MAKDMWGKIAVWAFLIGIVISLLIGLWQAYDIEMDNTPILATNNGAYVGWLLAFLGAIVGILAILGRGTITKAETPSFLMAGVALLIMYGVFSGFTHMLQPWLGPLLAGVSATLAIFIAPAVGILAIKAIWDIGKQA
jgi:uncharacterized membrane protein